MKSKFCPKCGKETDKFFDKLCESCFKEKNRLAEIPNKIKIRICSNCGKIEGNLGKLDEKSLEKIIEDNIKANGKIFDMRIIKNNGKTKVEVFGLLKGKIKTKEILETKIEIKKRLCETCGKVKGGYYEAVIQIRSEDKKKIENALEILVNVINKKGLITKVEEKSNGFDLYFTPKKILNQIIKNLDEVKEIKRSYTLVTNKEGRDLYRNTVLVRL